MLKTILSLLSALILLLSFSCASAQEARDITIECNPSSSGRKMGSLYDRKYTSFWNSREQRNPFIEFTAPADSPAQYMYICFGDMPKAWAIEEQVGGEWITIVEGSTAYHHAFVELGGKTHFRLIDTSEKNAQFKINELFVFSEGDVPDWVQRWEPTPEKADMLVLSAHPDDELIFFGGTIPTYDTERGMDVVVAYMTYSNTTRRSELLNGLWLMGVRSYPVIGEFRDAYSRKIEEAYSKWNKG